MVHIAGAQDSIAKPELCAAVSAPEKVLVLQHPKGHVMCRLAPEQIKKLQHFLGVTPKPSAL